MTATSAGLLLYRIIGTGEPEVLIGHMGGPFWSRKDRHGWSIPKGLYTDEEPLAAAEREFAEELGSPAPSGPTVPLGSVRQSSGKTVTVFARQGDFDADHISSNEFDIEWPRGSGRMRSFPEVDRAGWFSLDQAAEKLVKAQGAFLDRLRAHLSA
ncbi:NUDIX domain-containing protein [Tsukamurella paurometabola]|uniref:NUDIX hydrolase n=1 Tax=Tsukamurella paurometabola (strain ATCC 8368 / DSM 20162 / CCUG 35730 / CIP 100753 / JCM 10117 / KCTC 9821 / NBRC 16120 / NCIMB 702349 / NCTC 13040) TaxID=521096 RepID=D5UU86_TSUPD|nr:NUDIX domain-containing protein [Tsukamurella paurometabola]ADG79589.1 NUDIX hydrolase [Tsukamurella paurometabola DSM 20162]SUP36351.1 Predicted NTP pyrophosphohydrolase [Tsukamurella paurometabola]